MRRPARGGGRLAALQITGAGVAILALVALMLWAYTDASTGYIAHGPDAARRTVTGAATGTHGAVSPSQGGLPRDGGPPEGAAPG